MFSPLKNLVKRSRGLYLKLGPLFALYRNSVMRAARAFGGTDDNMVVFSSFDYRSYSDNPRYISEALHEMRPETDIVWLFKDGENARARFDIPDYIRIYNSIENRGVAAMARARVVVDNFNKRFYLAFPGRKQIYIQTWHGDRAFKKVGFDNAGQYTKMIEEHCSLGVTGSDYGDRQFRSAFHYKGELLKVGYPRNDILIRNDPAEAARIRARIGAGADEGLLLYAPTFRDTEQRAHAKQKVPLDLYRVLDRLEALDGRRWRCLVRAHYLSWGIPLDDGTGRLLPVSDYPEMAELLLISDALLTDYSSCAGDFALTRRPIFLYQDDLEDYQRNDRALYFDMKDSPYWVASTQEGLDEIIAACTPERARENCDAILKFYGEAETGHAAQSVAEYIVKQLRPAKEGAR